MHTYLVKVTAYYEGENESEVTEYGIVHGTTYADVAEKVSKTWGDSLDDMLLTRIVDDDVTFINKSMYERFINDTVFDQDRESEGE
jgi:hypothetical protein